MKTAFLSVIAAFVAVVTRAQEEATKQVDVNINAGGDSGHWYASPVVWIIGAAVFILLLVALSRGRSRN